MLEERKVEKYGKWEKPLKDKKICELCSSMEVLTKSGTKLDWQVIQGHKNEGPVVPL